MRVVPRSTTRRSWVTSPGPPRYCARTSASQTTTATGRRPPVTVAEDAPTTLRRPARFPDSMDGVHSGPVDAPARVRAQYPEVEAQPGMKVEHRGSRFGGVILRIERDGVVVRGR